MGTMSSQVLIGFAVIGILIVGFGYLIVVITRPFARHLPASPIARYTPPPGDIVRHGLAVRADRRVLSAAIIQLAVQRKVRVLTRPGSRRPVAIEARPGSGMTAQDVCLLQTLRPRLTTDRRKRRYLRALAKIGIHVPTVDAAPDVYFLKGRGAFRSHQRRALTSHFDMMRHHMKQEGLAHRVTVSVHLYLLSLLFLALVAACLFLGLGAVINGDGAIIFVFVPTVAAFFGVLTLAPAPILRFTDSGQDLRRRLSGLRDYVRMAEAERLRVLQSPDGALRTPAGSLTPGGQALGLTPQPTAGDPVAQAGLDRYVLTEQLLPYAVLFRCGRGWKREFEGLGGADASMQNLRTLGRTLSTLVTVLQMLLIMLQILRVIWSVVMIVLRV